MAGSTTFKVLFAGDASALKGAVDDAGGSMDRFGKMAGLAFLGVGAAAVGAAGVSLSAFSDFQGGMNEVFTLIPQAGKQTFDELTQQTKDFSKEFGVLPQDVIPALYQSLSAGVPTDNVFAFLETAQKAAKGGVTDLETAVDGISSVVNAYGTDVLSAAQASDLMFTAVRLGKTDFEQLSGSLFNVIPTAASMGVKFEDVTASLARLTAQGTPTSVATTQLRSLFVEAAKDGSKLDQTLRDISGKGFTELIAGGANVGEILQKVRGSMPDDEFRNLFGSVEAASAALGITGPQFDEFEKALNEMGASAGATDTAFAQMDQGLGPAVARIKAHLAVATIELGEKLAPAAEAVAKFIAEKLPVAFEALGRVVDRIEPPIRSFGQKALPYVKEALEGVRDVAATVIEKLRPVFDFFEGNKEAQMVLVAAGIGVLTVAMAALAISAGAAAVSMIAAAAPAIAIGAALGAVAAGVVLLIKHWDDITAKFPIINTVIDAVRGPLEAFAGWITGTFVPDMMTIGTGIQNAIGAAVGYIQEHWGTIWTVMGPVLETMKVGVELAFNNVKVVIETVLGVIKGIYEMWMGIFTGDWDRAWNGVKDQFEAIVNGLGGLFGNALQALLDLSGIWKPKLIQLGKDVGNWIGDQIAQLPSRMLGIGKDIANGLIDGIFSLKDWIVTKMTEFANLIPAPIRKVLEVFSPSRVMARDVGVPIAQGVAVGITQGYHEYVVPSLEEMAKGAAALAAITVAGSALTGAYVPGGNGLLPGQDPFFDANYKHEDTIPFGKFDGSGYVFTAAEAEHLGVNAGGAAGWTAYNANNQVMFGNDPNGWSPGDYLLNNELKKMVAGASGGGGNIRQAGRGSSPIVININVEGGILSTEQRIKEIVERSVRQVVGR